MQGAQVVSRVTAILKVLGAAIDEGASTTEIATLCALSRPTAHRLLSTLAREGLAERPSDSTKWRLGPEIHFLGMLARGHHNLFSDARPFLAELAGRTGESAFLSTRRGQETLCLLREEGSFPLRSFVLHEGSRFPLGVGSAGIAFLSSFTNHWVAEYLAKHDLSSPWGPQHAVSLVRDRVATARELGYALNPGLILEGDWGMAVSVPSSLGRPEWALSVTGVESRFRPERQGEMGLILADIAARLAATIARTPANSVAHNTQA